MTQSNIARAREAKVLKAATKVDAHWTREEDDRLLSGIAHRVPMTAILRNDLPGRTEAAAYHRLALLRDKATRPAPKPPTKNRNYNISEASANAIEAERRQDAIRGSRKLLAAELRYHAARGQFPGTLGGLQFRRLCAEHGVAL